MMKRLDDYFREATRGPLPRRGTPGVQTPWLAFCTFQWAV